MTSTNYSSGDWHDDRGWTDGWDPDTIRYTGYRPRQDSNQNPTNGYEFGAAHPGAMNGLFADGSVHALNYNIAANVFNFMGDRRDGQTFQFPP